MTPEKRKPRISSQKKPAQPIESLRTPRIVDPDFEAYFSLPQEDKSMFLRGLMVASNRAPTTIEFLEAELESSELTLTYGGEKFDKMYGALADSYAKTVDSTYNPDNSNNNPQTVQKRDMFYRMTRFHPAEEISESVKGILNRQAQGKK